MTNQPKQAALKITALKTQAICRAFFDSAKANLAGAAGDDASPESRAAAAFLCEQAISAARAEELEIGFCRSPERMTHTLAEDGFSLDEIAASGLLDDERIAGRLIGPILDAQARIVNFWAIRPIPRDSSVLFYRDPRGDVPCDLERDHPGETLRDDGLAAFLALIHGAPEPDPPEPEPEPEPKRKVRAKKSSRRPGYCQLHDCDETDCFCFD